MANKEILFRPPSPPQVSPTTLESISSSEVVKKLSEVSALLNKQISLLQSVSDKLTSLNTRIYEKSMYFVITLNGRLPGRATNVLNPGDEIAILDNPDERGQILAAIAVSNNPYVTYHVETKAPDGSFQVADLSAFEFNQIGNVLPTANTPYLARYDTTNNIYSILWTPAEPLPYVGVRFTIKNPPVTETLTTSGFTPTTTPNSAASIMFVQVPRRIFID